MTDQTAELTAPGQLLNVSTGEILPANPENAAAVLVAAREMKAKIQEVIRDAEAYLAEESKRQGSKTFHTGYGVLSLTGGVSTSYDPDMLASMLREAGCPETRIEEVVVATVSYKVDGRILRQLVAANPDYRAAADLAKIETETPLRASVKGGNA